MKKNILFLMMVLSSPLLTTSVYSADEETATNAAAPESTEIPATGLVATPANLAALGALSVTTPAGEDITAEEIVVPATEGPVSGKIADTDDASVAVDPDTTEPAALETSTTPNNTLPTGTRTTTIGDLLKSTEGGTSTISEDTSLEPSTAASTPTDFSAATAKVDQTPQETAATMQADQANAEAALTAAESDLKAGEADLKKVKEETKFNWKNSVYLKWLIPVLIILFLLYLAYATSSGPKDENEDDRNRHYPNNDPSCRDNGSCK